MRIKENLITLSDMDTWSLVLFVLYKIKVIPEYSTISEMAYVLDIESDEVADYILRKTQEVKM